VPGLMGRSDSSFRAMVIESEADTPGSSRASSYKDLTELDNEERRYPKGVNTFVKRMKDYGAK